MDYSKTYGKIPERIAHPAGWIKNYLRAPILEINPICTNEDSERVYFKLDCAAWRSYQTYT